MGFGELGKRLQILNRGMLVDMIEEILDTMTDDIEQMNKDQLQEGERSDGIFLPNYSYNTTQRNNNKQGRIKLFDTGAFYQSIFASAGLGILEIDAKDSKTELLKSEYGDLIIGLHPINMKELCDKIAVQLKVKVGNYLNQV